MAEGCSEKVAEGTPVSVLESDGVLEAIPVSDADDV